MKSEVRSPKSEVRSQVDDLLDISAVVAQGTVPRSVRSMREALDTLPLGRVLRGASLGQRLGYCEQVIRQNAVHPALNDYRMKLKGVNYFGSKETIGKAKAETLKR